MEAPPLPSSVLFWGLYAPAWLCTCREVLGEDRYDWQENALAKARAMEASEAREAKAEAVLHAQAQKQREAEACR